MHVYKIPSWKKNYKWINLCEPGNYCPWEKGYSKYCKSLHCYRHGQKNRIVKKNAILGWGEPDAPCYFMILKFGMLLPPEIVSSARTVFLNELKKKNLTDGIMWRLQFADYEPHFHMNNLIYASLTKPMVKECWETALTKIQHPTPSSPNVYCELCRDYEDSLAYLFEPKEPSTEHNCPPRIACGKWTHFKHSEYWPNV